MPRQLIAGPARPVRPAPPLRGLDEAHRLCRGAGGAPAPGAPSPVPQVGHTGQELDVSQPASTHRSRSKLRREPPHWTPGPPAGPVRSPRNRRLRLPGRWRRRRPPRAAPRAALSRATRRAGLQAARLRRGRRAAQRLARLPRRRLWLQRRRPVVGRRSQVGCCRCAGAGRRRLRLCRRRPRPLLRRREALVAGRPQRRRVAKALAGHVGQRPQVPRLLHLRGARMLKGSRAVTQRMRRTLAAPAVACAVAGPTAGALPECKVRLTSPCSTSACRAPVQRQGMQGAGGRRPGGASAS